MSEFGHRGIDLSTHNIITKQRRRIAELEAKVKSAALQGYRYLERCNALLDYIGNEVYECEGCGYITEISEVTHGPEGIEVCPECRTVEGFKLLEVS